MSAQTTLAKAVLAIYIVLSPFVLFVARSHGFRGAAILGWGYLSLFCTLKLVGSGIQISDPGSIGASIVSSIGLSPLLLAISGVLHEARYYRALILAPPSGSRYRLSRPDILAIVLFHGFIATGVALVATGASGLATSGVSSGNPFASSSSSSPSSSTSAATQSSINNDFSLATAGAAIATVGWGLVTATALVTLATWRRTSPISSSNPAAMRMMTDSDTSYHALHSRSGQGQGRGTADDDDDYDAIARSAERKQVQRPMWLLLGVIYALPFLGVRVAASLVLFAGKVSALSPAGGGNTGLVVGLEVVEEVIVVVVLTAAGLLTRGVVREGAKV